MNDYAACAFALGRGLYCTVDVRTPHIHVPPQENKEVKIVCNCGSITTDSQGRLIHYQECEIIQVELGLI